MISKNAAKNLRDLFVGQVVVIYLRDMNIITVDDNGTEMKITAMAQGFFLDADETFVYLGTPDGEVTRVIAHETAQMIEIEFPGDEFMDGEMLGPDEEAH